ncbi:MAG: hypothetical protein ACLFM1_01495 [Bacteroidales bacterium]
MKTITKLIFFALMVGLVSSCAHKRLAKKASEFEEKGMYTEASELYYQSVLKKSTFIDARLGLKRTGQRVVDSKFSEFTKAYDQGNNKQAVYYYLEARDYEKKLNSVGIELTVPPYYEEYYNEVKGTYLEDKYFDGEKFLNNDEFGKAEEVFREICEIDKNYKDATEKLKVAIYEPKYRNGMKNLGKGKYRSAYYLFDDVLKNYGDYKDASDLKAEALDKATIRIGVDDFKNSTKNQKIDEQLKSQIIQALNQSDNPFIKVVQYETKSSRSRSVRDSKNKNIQPDAILTGHVLSYNYDMGRLKKETKPGYLKVVTSYKDDEGNTKTRTRYEKVSYEEYSMSRGVSIDFNFQLVDTKNNEIIITRNINQTQKDHLHYADYDGKKKNLVPGYWKNKHSKSEEDVIKTDRNSLRNLHRLLSARKKIKTYETLTNELMEVITNKAATAVNDYNPE